MADDSDDIGMLHQRIRALEAALEKSEAERRRLELAFECAPVAMGIGDLRSGTALANRALRDRMGAARMTTVAEIVAATHPDDIEEDARLFGELVAGVRDRYELDKRYILPDGRIDWAHLAVAICRETPEPLTVATLQDINELKGAEERLRTVTETLPIACVISSLSDGVFRYVNPAAADMFEADRDALIGGPVIGFYDDPADRAAILEILAERGEVDGYEAWFVSRSGKRQRLSVALRRVVFDGEPCMMGVGTDVTERYQAQEALERALVHSELLLREIHHRVKNNLQVMSSLLYLQGEAVEDRRIRALFTSNRHRIAAMGTIHDALADSEGATLPIEALIQKLAGDLRTAWNPGHPIELHFDLLPVELPRDRVLPCILIVNELVSNAFKHAFPDAGGSISVGLEATPTGQCVVRVADDGVGMPENPSRETLGMVLVSALVEQLQGELGHTTSKQGTLWDLQFPIGSF